MGLMKEVIEMSFRKELEKLINKHSMENGSNTPDFILGRYLIGCLQTFDDVVNAREEWYGRQSHTNDSKQREVRPKR